jgi:dCMP deaminase
MSKLNYLKELVNGNNERSSWDEYFMGTSLWISSRSPSDRLKVGAVIVNDNRIISAGYNGFPAGVPHKSIMRDGHEQNTIHAEQNAISDAARRGVSIVGSTIYITHYPCINCTKCIISSGIKTIKFLDNYRNDEIVGDLLNASQIKIFKL